MNSTSTPAWRNCGFSSTTSILDPGNFDNILIAENYISSGGYGISVYGDAASLATQIEIANNYIADFMTMEFISAKQMVFILTEIYWRKSRILFHLRTRYRSRKTRISMQWLKITNFIFFNKTTAHKHLGEFTFSMEPVTEFFNNEISVSALTTGNFTGIEIRTSATAPEISFNVISCEDTAAAAGNFIGISEELSNTNSVLKNNLISITTPGTGTRAALKLGTTSAVTTAFQSNYNDYWVPSGNVALKGTTNPTLYQTLADWQSTKFSGCKQRFHWTSVYISDILLPTNPALNNLGTPIAWVTMDIDGNPRDPGHLISERMNILFPVLKRLPRLYRRWFLQILQREESEFLYRRT